VTSICAIGPSPVFLNIWLFSHKLLITLQGAQTTTDEVTAAFNLASTSGMRRIRVQLKPGELMLLHGNVVHAGALSARVCTRVVSPTRVRACARMRAHVCVCARAPPCMR
jgi:hypothetical protein